MAQAIYLLRWHESRVHDPFVPRLPPDALSAPALELPVLHRLTLNNALLVIDRLVVKDIDLATWRLVPAVAGLGALVYGLVWDGK